eukprot:SAG31_NODE_6491_length_1998_cov_1.360716_2_plen_120_part_00
MGDDLNWGDMVTCANENTEISFLGPSWRRGMVFPLMVSAFRRASERGVLPNHPAIFIDGVKSEWPHYQGAKGAEEGLLGELCRTYANGPGVGCPLPAGCPQKTSGWPAPHGALAVSYGE